MGSASTGRASKCRLCDQPLNGEPSVATRTNERVHIACADADAMRAWRWRTARALAHLAALIVTLTVLWTTLGFSPAIVALGLAWSLLHGLMHRRWWYYAARDLRRLLR